MAKLSLFISPVFCLISFCLLSNAKESARPMSEMRGDCSNYKMTLVKEMNLWKAQPKSSKDSIELDLPYNLELTPQNKIQFPVTPEKFFSKDDSQNGGFFAFSVANDGIYKVSSGSKVWFDIADSEHKTLVPAIEFEMQTKCETIFKAVKFELKSKVKYFLQINSSPAASSRFLITKE